MVPGLMFTATVSTDSSSTDSDTPGDRYAPCIRQPDSNRFRIVSEHNGTAFVCIERFAPLRMRLCELLYDTLTCDSEVRERRLNLKGYPVYTELQEVRNRVCPAYVHVAVQIITDELMAVVNSLFWNDEYTGVSGGAEVV
jgi:hypothetical protein